MRSERVMDQSTVARNLPVMGAHFGGEAAGRIDAAVELYTDDVVWEAASRDILLHDKQAAADNYRAMFGAILNVTWETLDRFATEDRVVDDSIVTFEVAAEGCMPLPVGTRCRMRLTHIFEIRDGKISKEIGIEGPPRPL